MGIVDPKVFFSNERTFLKWLHTSVTLGSIGAALLGIRGLGASTFDPLRLVGLSMIAVSIFFCIYTLTVYHKRNALLKTKAGFGYDSMSGPWALSAVLIVALSSVYVLFLVNRTAAKI